MKTDQLSNMAAQGGIITIGFLDQMRGETVINPFVKPQAFATFGSPAPENKKKLGENISESFYSLLERWDAISNSYEDMDISDARKKWIIPLLRELGFDPGFNREDVMANGDENLKFKLSHRGWVSPGAPMIHTVAPKQKLETRPTDGKGSKRSPHDEMQTFLNVSKDHKWGIVTNGISFRILRDFFHTTTKGYVEFDIENIMRERSYSDFRAFYRMAHASRFRGGNGNGDYPLEQFYKESVTAGEKVGPNLRGNVKKAIEVFGNGFLTLTPELTEQMIADEELCKKYYNEILRVIYRILFLLYAEQRAMLPTRDSLYIDEYSITRLRKIAESRKGKDDHCDLWEGLKITFRMLAEGCNPLNVFPYNGSLFDKSEIPTIRELTIKNHDLLEAIRCLTLFEEDHILKRINYLDLDAEEIGSIYESLLDYIPRVLPSAMEIDGRTIPANEFFLDPRGSARKTTGSYYTDKRLVDELIKSALKPVAERKMAESEDKESSILSLKVCDPACGSGAFLIAATNYLGKELAKVRTGQSEPPDTDIRRARRDVLQRCIYGVDQNPMVVELAKVSLWIDAAVKDKPLNFLDHHIKCGNSLIGATPELIEQGIPDEAFNPVEGDDRKVAKEIKSKNKNEKKQQTLDEFGLEKEPTWAYEYEKLSHAEEDDVDSVKWKQECYRAIVESPKRQHEKLVADTWCSAFFWQLNGDAPPPTEATLRTMQKEMADGCVDPDTQSTILELAEEHRFFHWHLEFPDVFEGAEGGFDCVLGNPPWDVLQAEEKPWFIVRDEKIGLATGSDRKMIIKELEKTNPDLYKGWISYKKSVDNCNLFLKHSGRFNLTAKGKLNYYPLFAENDKQIINGGGSVGMVIASGIATDFYNQNFFQNVVGNGQLVSLYDFENRERIFSEIHSSYKFSLLTLTGKEVPVQDADFAFYLTNPDHIQEEDRHFTLTNEEIELLNPNTKTCPIFRSKKDAELTKKIYRKHPALIKENPDGEDENPWGISFKQGLFNMTSDSALFKNKDQLAGMGFELDGNIFRRGRRNLFTFV
ncbi:MAG: restriction endonuclease [Candidatus Methanogaster sp.]|uniref:Restriction endonuclease n=1 Tax=Candidatus Methanogaster sp. TaxID=3386292 RepID=A0AC61L5B1_9EURY|nr:MAG: restriction endonuclease [ANME-2 cluster archaeon]